MNLIDTGLMDARDLNTMNNIQQWRWLSLAKILPGVGIHEERPKSLREVDWVSALVFTATNEVTEEEIYNYFLDLRNYYNEAELRWLLRHVEKYVRQTGRAGKYIRLVQRTLYRVLNPM